MFITRLNRLFEKHGKVAFIVMLFVIVGPFVFFIGSASLLDVMRGKAGRGGAPSHLVKIGGKKYNEAELRVHQVAESLGVRGQQQPSASILWQRAVDRMLMLGEAKKLGLGEVSEAELVKEIRSNPMVQTDGKFDQNKFNYLKAVLAREYGISPADYDTMVGYDIVLRRLNTRYMSEAEKSLTSEEAVKKDYIENQTKFECLTRQFMASDYEKQAETEYLARFKTPAEREAEAKKYYEATVEPLRTDIDALLAAGKGNDAPREALQDVKSRLTADLKLTDAEVDKQLGEYRGKLLKALPFFVWERKKVMAITFPLAKYPATATPEEIKKEFEAGKEQNYKDKKLEEVQADIEKSLVHQKSLAAASKAAAKFKDIVYDRAQNQNLVEGQTVQTIFEAVAKEQALKVETSNWFDDKTEATAAGINGAVVAKAYGELSDVKPLSSVIEGSDACYASCWLATQPAVLPKFTPATAADIQEKVLKAVAEEEAPKLASKDAAAVLAAVKAAPLVEADLAAKFKMKNATLTREMDYEKILAGFKTTVAGDVSGPIDVPAFYYMPATVKIARLLKVTPPTDEEFAKAKVEHRQRMIQEEVGKKMNALREKLRKENKVEFNRLEVERRR